MATAAELNLFNQLMATGDYAGAARVAQQAGYSPDVVASYINQNLAGLNLPTNANISADVVQSLYTPSPQPPSPPPPPPPQQPSATSPEALLQRFNDAMVANDFNTASSLINQASQIYGPDTFANMANYLGLPSAFASTGFTPAALESISSTFTPNKPPTDPVTPSAGVLSNPLAPGAGTSQIDPVIAPYLSEALGTARSLFLTGEQPELYPGQMYVSPSEQTLSALSGIEEIAGAAQPFFMKGAEGVMSGLEGLRRTAGGEFLGGATFKNAAGEDVNYRDALISAATRPLTQQFTEEVMPGIQSTFSRAGRLGSGAQGAVTGRATEGYTRALGDVTSRIAAEDYARERGFQEAATRDVLSGAGQLGNIFSSFLAPSQALGQVGAQREAIAAQPLQEAIQRFEYTQNLPQQQFANYMASIYGSPLGNVTQRQSAQTNQLGQVLGGGILGSQLGSLFGGAGGFSGGQIGAGLGALGGLLL